jgi:hypothetical protein
MGKKREDQYTVLDQQKLVILDIDGQERVAVKNEDLDSVIDGMKKLKKENK